MNWTLLLPELTLLLTMGLFLLLACLPPKPHRDYYWAMAAAVILVAVSLGCARSSGELFRHTYRIDLFSQVFKVFLASGYFLVILLYNDHGEAVSGRESEIYLLLSASTLAMMLLASGVHLLTLFLSLELSSYSLYILVLLRRHRNRGQIPGLHFFLTGAGISALMLMGMALIYSASGTLYAGRLIQDLPPLMTQPVAAAGVFLMLTGFLFKLAVFPFHIWAPDTYQGAPNQVAAFLATVSKLSAVAVLLRIMSMTEGGAGLVTTGLVALAIITMTVGNLSAIAQKDFKRLMAFSSVAHAGYLLIGIICLTPDGRAATMFYGVSVLVLKFTCFMVMINIAGDGRNVQIAEFADLHRRAPILAMALMIALFGLAGIPPTIGFAGKFLIFNAAIKSGYLVLVIIAMFNVVVSLYYYLLVLKSAYLDKPSLPASGLNISLSTNVLAVALIAVIIVFGFFPTPLWTLMQAAALHLP